MSLIVNVWFKKILQNRNVSVRLHFTSPDSLRNTWSVKSRISHHSSTGNLVAAFAEKNAGEPMAKLEARTEQAAAIVP